MESEKSSVLQLWLRYIRVLRAYWFSGILVGLLMFVGVAVQIPGPFIFKYIFDTLVPAENLAIVINFALLLLALSVTKLVLGWLQQHTFIKYKNSIAVFMRSILIKKLVNSNHSKFSKSNTGYLKERVNDDLDRVGASFIDIPVKAALHLSSLVIGISIALYFSVTLTLIVTLCLLPSVYFYTNFGKEIYNLSAQNREKWGRFNGYLIELLSRINFIKVYNLINVIEGDFKSRASRAVSSTADIEKCHMNYGLILGFFQSLIPLSTLCIGAYLIITSDFTLGGLIGFSACLPYFLEPVKSIAGLNVNFSSAKASAERIFEIIDLTPESNDYGSVEITKIENISLVRVDFNYGTSRKGLKEVSFDLSKGENLCIIGHSGSGKSSLCKIILGLEKPSAGKFYINSQEYTNFTIQSIRERIGYVEQEPHLFSGTILDNFRIIDPGISEDRVHELLEIVQLEHWIRSLEQGLETSMFELGSGVSGGERQRLSIALSLIHKPDILLLDEATAALDPATELNLLRELLKLEWNPSVISITHRYSQKMLIERVLDLSHDCEVLQCV